MPPQSNQAITALLNRIAQSDDKAATELYRLYYGYVYAYLRFKMGDELAAEEATQDVLLAVCRQPLSFRSQSKFTTWLCGIANNKAADRQRKAGRQLPMADVEDEVLESLPAPEADLVDQMADRQNAEAVRRCIERLPEKHREAVFLAYYEEASMDEIAERTQCPAGTVKSRLSHARAKLLDCLKAWLEGQHD